LDYDLYKASLGKLMQHDIEICGFDHFTAVVGEEARQVLVNGLKRTDEYQEHIVSLYRCSNDIEDVARHVAREASKFDALDYSNEDFMMPVYRAEVRNILRASGISAN